MASQIATSGFRTTPVIGINRAGLILALLVGGLHLLWSLLVMSGFAQPFVDFVFWLHSIRPVYVIEPFEPIRAAALIAYAAVAGYVIGAAFAFLWNRILSNRL